MTSYKLTPSSRLSIKCVYGAGLLVSLMAIAFEMRSVAEAQESPSAQQVVDACVDNQVTTLPNPYSDLSSDHWAYEAVLKMYYCGVIRPGVSETVVERLTGVTPSPAAENDTDPSQ